MLVKSLIPACVVDQNFQQRLTLRIGICCLFHAMQALKIPIEKAEIQITLLDNFMGAAAVLARSGDQAAT